jgi:hypothetical protein
MDGGEAVTYSVTSAVTRSVTRAPSATFARGSFRRLGWLALVALPLILAACGNNGTSGY